jgi:Calcium-dependent channel, 7TM region, putative phosphate
MVMLVYAVISPVTSFVTALCFLVMGSIFRHQFVYIYPTVPDSGGKIWMSFIRTLLPCLIVAEITSMF